MKKTGRIFFRVIIMMIIQFLAVEFILKKIFGRGKKNKIGLLNIEFYHKEVSGFGGYGKTAKNITDHFNSNGNSMHAEIILTRHFKKPEIRQLHNTNVIIAPDAESSNIINAVKYTRMLNSRDFKILLTIEYCTDYQYSIFFSS